MTSHVDVLVVAAMADEAAAVSSLCKNLRAFAHPFAGGGKGRDAGTSGEVSASVGTLECAGSGAQGADGYQAPIALVTTGVGTAAASAVLAWAVGEFSPRLIVNVGSCGGLAEDITVGTVAIGSSYAYSIAEATAFGYETGQVPGAPAQFGREECETRARRALEAVEAAGLPARAGLMLSGDAFVTADIADGMRAKFPGAITADMESCAFAHVAHLMQVPFLALRAVSDLCSPRANEEFHIGLEVAAQASAQALAQALPALR